MTLTFTESTGGEWTFDSVDELLRFAEDAQNECLTLRARLDAKRPKARSLSAWLRR